MITEDAPYHHCQHTHRHHDHHYQILLNSHAFHRGVSVRKKKVSGRYMSQHDSDDGDDDYDDDDGDVDGV